MRERAFGNEVDMDEFVENLPLLAPVMLVWLIMLIAGLSDLVRGRETRGPRWLWYVVVICFGILGPALYFLYGRQES